MGRQHVSEEMRRQTRIPEASRSEVHGTHRSNDLMRLLPSEFLNLEDETLETLFYARLLEHGLLTYQLSGQTMVAGETAETRSRRTGPVLACWTPQPACRVSPCSRPRPCCWRWPAS